MKAAIKSAPGKKTGLPHGQALAIRKPELVKSEPESGDLIVVNAEGKFAGFTKKGMAALRTAFAVGNVQDEVGRAVLLFQTAQCLPFSSDPLDPTQLSTALAGVVALEPKDAMESMICSQMVALHAAGMEFLRKAMESQRSPQCGMEITDAYVNRSARLLRVFGQLADTLRAKRSGGTQRVIVERVDVHAGGQAIVGTVDRGGGGRARKKRG